MGGVMGKSLMVVSAALASWGATAAQGQLPPHLSPAGRAEFQAYVEAPGHRAFAIAPGGAWGWSSGQASASAAQDQALATCQAQTRQRCVPYAVDERTVFDREAWGRLWGPYADAAKARRAPVGTALGQRMPDLAFADAKGVRRSLAALKGKAVVLHFWGAWCGPCRQELPDLQKLYKAMAGRPDVAFVLLQAREKFDVSGRWAARQGLDLPLYDSGSAGDDDAEFRLAGGRRIADRDIASRFPTTYVLDRHGLVVFSHVGPIHDWPAYEAFLRDVADRSGH